MLSHETRERLAKLIPRLASDQDGEVVATARAIDRTLKAANADLHDLTALLTGRRSGWAPAGTEPRGSASPKPSDTGHFSYADTFRESAPLFAGPEHAEAQTRRFGLPLYTAERIEPWPEVARHCLRLNQKVPRKHGGKFLLDWHKKMLRTFIDDLRVPTNRQVDWIEKTVARLHQARDAAARAAEGSRP